MFGAANVATSEAGGAAVVELPAAEAVANVVGSVAVSYSAAPPAGGIEVKDGDAVVLDLDIVTAGLTVVPLVPPARGSVGQALTVTARGGGGTVVAKLFVHAWREGRP